MAEKLSSAFDSLLDENRKQMGSLFGTDRKPVTSAPPAPSVAPHPSPEPAPESPPPEQAPMPPESGHISGTARGIPFTLKISE
jgi:hypothetical protein